MDIKLRVVENPDGAFVLQQKLKNQWYDGSTTTNGRRGWSIWEDVPILKLGEY